jgi:hypothetical protein
MRVLTKAGYFASKEGAADDSRQQMAINIAEAVRSTIPFPALALTIENVLRHPDTGRVEFTVELKSGSIGWQAAENGTSTANLKLAAASLTENRDVLASKMESVTVSADSQDSTRLAGTLTRVPIRLRVPPKTRSIRVVVQTAEDGRIGATEIDQKTLDAAPQAPTPETKLIRR